MACIEDIASDIRGWRMQSTVVNDVAPVPLMDALIEAFMIHLHRLLAHEHDRADLNAERCLR